MSERPDVQDVIARLQKAVETDDWCELKPDETRELLRYVGTLQLHGLEQAAARAAGLGDQ